MMETGKPNGVFLGLIFVYFYFQGIQGTFAYHKLKKEHGGPPPRVRF
jgi:hypothetical protein